MEKLTLVSESRDTNVKLSTLRSASKIPSVVYGHKFDPRSIMVDYSEFLKVFRKGGKTHLVELTVDGKKQTVLIHDVQRHPVSGDFIHIDFFVVSTNEKIHVSIPLHLIGESQAQKEGAMIEQNMHALEVKCLAKDLIDSLEVDISKLEKVGEIIHVQDLGLDLAKFDILSPLDGAVASAHAPKAIKEEEPTEIAEVQSEEAASQE